MQKINQAIIILICVALIPTFINAATYYPSVTLSCKAAVGQIGNSNPGCTVDGPPNFSSISAGGGCPYQGATAFNGGIMARFGGSNCTGSATFTCNNAACALDDAYNYPSTSLSCTTGACGVGGCPQCYLDNVAGYWLDGTVCYGDWGSGGYLYYSCSGQYATARANRKCISAGCATAKPGACGTANAKTYGFTATGFGADTICSIGTSTPSTVSFPAAGSTASWTCRTATGSANCSATHSAAANCSAGGVTVLHGASRTFYQTSTVACGASCASVAQTRTCNNGTLSGTYTNATCTEPPAINGNWTSWSACNSGIKTRTCTNPSPSCGGAGCSGLSSDSCTNASCGTNARAHTAVESTFTGTFCASGNAPATTPSFPASGASTTWTCTGINGGTNSTCTATRAAGGVPTATCADLSISTGFRLSTQVGCFYVDANIINNSGKNFAGSSNARLIVRNPITATNAYVFNQSPEAGDNYGWWLYDQFSCIGATGNPWVSTTYPYAHCIAYDVANWPALIASNQLIGSDNSPYMKMKTTFTGWLTESGKRYPYIDFTLPALTNGQKASVPTMQWLCHRLRNPLAADMTYELNCTPTAVNNPPLLLDFNLATTVNSAVKSELLTNYVTDESPSTLTYQITSENTAQVDCAISDKNILYTPAANYAGNATCVIRVTDDGGLTSTATARITVSGEIANCIGANCIQGKTGVCGRTSGGAIPLVNITLPPYDANTIAYWIMRANNRAGPYILLGAYGYQPITVNDSYDLNAGLVYYYNFAKHSRFGDNNVVRTEAYCAQAYCSVMQCGGNIDANWSAIAGSNKYFVYVSTDNNIFTKVTGMSCDVSFPSGMGVVTTETQFNSVCSTNFTIPRLNPNTLYYFKVEGRSRYYGGESSQGFTGTATAVSSQLCTTTPAPPCTAPINGICGNASTAYAVGTTTWPVGAVFCADGNAIPSSPTFPIAGTPTIWDCNGLNGGNSVTCNATVGACSPDTNTDAYHCARANAECGNITVQNGNCGNKTVNCGPDTNACNTMYGTCNTAGVKTCSANKYSLTCATVDPRISYCATRVCGSDLCGGTCGSGCGAGLTCNASGQCIPAPENSITSLSAIYDGNLNLESQCAFEQPNARMIINYLDTNEEIANYSPYLCGATSQTQIKNIPNLRSNTNLVITLTIPAPCDVCIKTIYLPIKAVNQKTESIPDNNLIAVILVLAAAVILISAKRRN